MTAGAGRLVYVASSTCYGIPEQYPTPEDAPIDTRYPYAHTKHQGELLACTGTAATGCRMCHCASSTSTVHARAQPALTAQSSGSSSRRRSTARPFTVVGDGEQTRDFTYVTDIAEAMIKAADAADEDVAGEVINVASGNPQSVNRLVELLGGPVVHVPKRPGEPDCTWADITKARERLGWEPTISFEHGVARMLEQIEDWRGGPRLDAAGDREGDGDVVRLSP